MSVATETSLAEELAAWAHALRPTEDDLALAARSLRDTLAVALAARQDPLRGIALALNEAAAWAAMAHVLDFDDLHLESTAHISAVCVPAVLATGGDARAYLAAAGVMTRLGGMLGWAHYARGWHATCTAGAPAAAVGAAMALGLDEAAVARAIALALPAAGGVQRAFGTASKALQVGFAAHAGVRAAGLAALGAGADPAALDDWLPLVGGTRDAASPATPAVPGGLAIKLFPCCYALQRPISTARLATVRAEDVDDVTVRTLASTVQPLIHHRPRTGLQGKFSLEYAVAAALLDGYPRFASFEDAGVRRGDAQRLLQRVTVEAAEGGGGLLDGDCVVEVRLTTGTTLIRQLDQPPGSPSRPPTDAELRDKFAACGDDVPELLDGIDWRSAAALLREQLPATGTVA